jgi:hypothetical protein
MQPFASAEIVVAAIARMTASPANIALMSLNSVRRCANPRRANSFRPPMWVEPPTNQGTADR